MHHQKAADGTNEALQVLPKSHVLLKTLKLVSRNTAKSALYARPAVAGKAVSIQHVLLA